MGHSGWAWRWSTSPRPAPRRPPGLQRRASGRQVPTIFGFHLRPSCCDAGGSPEWSKAWGRDGATWTGHQAQVPLRVPGAVARLPRPGARGWSSPNPSPAYKAGDGSRRRSSRNSSRACRRHVRHSNPGPKAVNRLCNEGRHDDIARGITRHGAQGDSAIK